MSCQAVVRPALHTTLKSQRTIRINVVKENWLDFLNALEELVGYAPPTINKAKHQHDYQKIHSCSLHLEHPNRNHNTKTIVRKAHLLTAVEVMETFRDTKIQTTLLQSC